jgi:hypothetical protein
MEAELTGNDVVDALEPVATFTIHEYSGKPPHLGGGFRIEKVDSVEATVDPGASFVRASWKVHLTAETAPDGEVPEFRFTVEWAGTKAVSKLLKVGQIDEIGWETLGAPGPIPPGFGDCVARIDEGEPVGVRVKAKGLDGFRCDIEVFEQVRGQPDGAPIAVLRGIPIRAGVARTRWTVPAARATELSNGRLQLALRLRHGSHRYLPRRSRSKPACFITPRRVFFAIYYIVPDAAFRRAAFTWAEQVKALPAWSRRCDMVVKGVRKEADFRAAWDLIHQGIADSGIPAQVVEGHLFTHGVRDGLEFEGEGNTYDRNDIKASPVLPWDPKDGFLVLHGCNTAIPRKPNWSPSGEFAARQRVPTLGQLGYSYMSAEDEQYVRINRNTPRVYLWTYKRGQNDPFGDGRKTPGEIAHPPPLPRHGRRSSRSRSRTPTNTARPSATSIL